MPQSLRKDLVHFVQNRQCMFCDFANRCWDMSDSEFLSNKEMMEVERKANKRKSEVLAERNMSKELSKIRTSVPVRQQSNP